MPSRDYYLFIWSCFPKGPIEAKDGLAHDALLRLSGEEKQQAIDLLMNNLTEFLNGAQIQERVIEAIGILRLIEAVPLLQELLRLEAINNHYYVQSEIGLALHRIKVYPEGIDLAVQLLEHPPDSTSWWEFLGTYHLFVYAQEYQRAVRHLVKYLDSSNLNLARSATRTLRDLFRDYPLILKELETIQESLLVKNEQKFRYKFNRRRSIARVTKLILDEITNNGRWK